MDERFRKQIQFIIEVDKIKSIFRRTKLFDGTRRENDAEHSWHIALMACIMSEYSNVEIDLLKVIKMQLVHDLVEIDAGDIIVYAENQTEKYDKEKQGALRVFGLLPEDQRDEYLGLWLEFEERKTPEARFAGALDRLEPIMQNYLNGGDSWIENNIEYDRIVDVNQRIGLGSDELWHYAMQMIEEYKENKII